MFTHPSVVVTLLVAAATAAAGPDADTLLADQQLLTEYGIATEPAALLDFFRKRTLTDDDRAQVARLVRQLGAESFALRESATRELALRGTPVRAAVQAVLTDADREVARRAARCLEEIDSGPGLELPAAAARMLGRRPTAGAVAVLLAFLPHAADEQLEEAVIAALLALHTETGRLDPTIVTALSDARPLIRGAAAHVAGRRGDLAQRTLVRKLLADGDLKVRFRAARALLAGGDRAAGPAIIELLAEGPFALLWQVEEVLYQLAGDKAPSVPAAEGSAARRQVRDIWSAWWDKHGATVDLTRLDDRERLSGLTLGVEYNTGRVWEAGLDGTVRWELTGLSGPMDAHTLPGGRVLIAEANARRVTERDRTGQIIWEKKLDGEPTGCQRLANGNTFVSTYSSVMEFRRDGSTAFSFALGGGSNAIRKHKNGHIIYAVQGELIEVDTAGNRIRTISIPKESMWVGILDLPGDHFLLANSSSGRVIEVDRAGKVLWEGKVPGACGVARLPNGHTLVATSQRVVELDRGAKPVWEKRSGGYVRRVQRR